MDPREQIEFEIRIYGGAITCSTRCPGDPRQNWTYDPDQRPRGRVKGFSQQSRAAFTRLFTPIPILDYAAPAADHPQSKSFLLTFACPDQPSAQDWARTKEKMRRAFETRFPGSGAIVKWEIGQRRKTLHGHAVLFAPEYLDTKDTAAWLQKRWRKISKTTNPADTDTRCLYDDCQRLISYLSKPAAPEGVDWSYGLPYSVWGTLPYSIPTSIAEQGLLKYSTAILTLKRLFPDDRKIQQLSTNWDGFSIRGLSPEQLEIFEHEVSQSMQAS